MSPRIESIVVVNETPVVSSFIASVNVDRKLSIDEEYKKHPLAVYCRLLVQHEYEELALLIKEHGEPGEVTMLNELTIHGSSDFALLRKDLAAAQEAFVALSGCVKKIAEGAKNALEIADEGTNKIGLALDYCKIAGENNL